MGAPLTWFDKRLSRGFTIVELLIVVVVIAILAAITVVAYNGISQQAKESTLKSELRSAAKQVELVNVNNGAYPDDGGSLVADSDVILSYSSGGTSYCLSAKRSTGGKSFRTTESGVLEEGECSTGATGLGEAYAGIESMRFGIARNADGLYYGPKGSSVNFSESLLDIVYPWGDSGATILAGSSSESGNVDGQGNAARFYGVGEVVLDGAGNIYASDSYADNTPTHGYTVVHSSIRKITPSGLVTTLAGGPSGHVDGQGSAAQLYRFTLVGVDPSGNIYGYEDYEHLDQGSGVVSQRTYIRKITPSGQVTTLAGGPKGYVDGQGLDARFDNLYGAVIDTAGNIYVIDNSDYPKIRKITPSGTVSTLAGGGYGYENGKGLNASFRRLEGSITIDDANNIYVVDRGSNGQMLRKITPSG